jgi:restriction system protein
MAIPDYQSVMLPLLKFADDGVAHRFVDACLFLANEFHLSDEEKEEVLPSGQQKIYCNRIGWARTYLKQAGLLDTPRRGFLKITDRGNVVLLTNPPTIDNKFLSQFAEFNEFRAKGRNKAIENTSMESKPQATGMIAEDIDATTPEEAFENAYERLKSELLAEIIDNLKSCGPALFEKIVIEVLVRMGYGGSLQDAGKAVGKSHDGGIDGIINEDRLGLDSIYIQAKRWQSVVGRPEIQKFAGALSERHARKGVFITTSYFSKEAIDCVLYHDTKIILIDGKQLAGYMIEFNVGVSTIAEFTLKKIDVDYFFPE